MADFNKILNPGDVENGIINVVIEIPEGSSNKIEWDRERAAMRLDRVEPKIFAKPTNYGLIPQTLDLDGDELDVLMITDEPLPTGLYLEARYIGVMKFEDNGEIDDKIVAVPAVDYHYGNSINSLDDISKQKIDQIAYHFSHYKDHKEPGSTIVKGWGDADEAREIIEQSIERWNIVADLSE